MVFVAFHTKYTQAQWMGQVHLLSSLLCPSSLCALFTLYIIHVTLLPAVKLFLCHCASCRKSMNFNWSTMDTQGNPQPMFQHGDLFSQMLSLAIRLLTIRYLHSPISDASFQFVAPHCPGLPEALTSANENWCTQHLWPSGMTDQRNLWHTNQFVLICCWVH